MWIPSEKITERLLCLLCNMAGLTLGIVCLTFQGFNKSKSPIRALPNLQLDSSHFGTGRCPLSWKCLPWLRTSAVESSVPVSCNGQRRQTNFDLPKRKTKCWSAAVQTWWYWHLISPDTSWYGPFISWILWLICAACEAVYKSVLTSPNEIICSREVLLYILYAIADRPWPPQIPCLLLRAFFRIRCFLRHLP